MDNSEKFLANTITRLAKVINLTSLKGYLSELRSYEDSNELKKPEEFEKLIDRICKELPDEYSEKIKSIRFYQKQEDYEGLDDLPF